MRFTDEARLHAALPVYKGGTIPAYWVVAVERLDVEAYHRWVSAEAGSLDDGHWTHGNYFHTEAGAVADMLTRSGVFNLTYGLCDSIAAEAHPVSAMVRNTPLP